MIRQWKSRQSLLIAGGVTLVLFLWMLSGQLGGKTSPDDTVPTVTQRDPRVAVRYRELQAESVQRFVQVSGRTAPARSVTLRAEVDGRVLDRVQQKGARVTAGTLIVQLDPQDRKEQLAMARATLRERQLQYEAAQRLRKQDFQTETQLASALAAREAAQAEVRRMELALEHTELHVPFAGVLDGLPVEVGSYVQAGDSVAQLLEMDPLLVTGDVTEQEVRYLQPGMSAGARLATGEEVQGELRFVASEADAATRTFPIELAVANPGAVLAAGITAEIMVPTGNVSAHYLSSALLSLDAEGQVGVKAVGPDDTVQFHPVTIVRSGADGLWVTGLPERVRVITVGQGYVHGGDRVRPVPEATVLQSPGQHEGA